MTESGIDNRVKKANSFEARSLFSGEAGSITEGDILVLKEPLSFWGGFDLETGSICDNSHPQVGTVLTGKVLVMRSGRGSSSASSVLTESIRSGVGPCAILMKDPDPILALGAIVAAELYDTYCPVAVVDNEHWHSIVNANSITLMPIPDSDNCLVKMDT